MTYNKFPPKEGRQEESCVVSLLSDLILTVLLLIISQDKLVFSQHVLALKYWIETAVHCCVCCGFFVKGVG